MAKENIVELVRKEYEKGLAFKAQIDLFNTVRTNENFFIGKQWEGVQANGLPTPVFNFIKRVVLFTISNIVTDNLKLHASAFSAATEPKIVNHQAEIVNAEFERITEQIKLGSLLREMARNAAVDGDGCLFAYWDDKVDMGQKVRGAIKCEVIENTRVFFGNPNDRCVQSQPYIIIAKRRIVDEVKDRVKETGDGNVDAVKPDTDDSQSHNSNLTDDKVTVMMKLWRDKKSGTIHAVETTKDVVVRSEWDTGLKLYPLVWLNWDYVQDCYHGQSMISGLIPNQVFVNKLFAMSMLSLMTTAYPKVIYDRTRVQKWDNRVGAAIPVNGGDVNNVAKVIDPTTISPQIAQFIELAIERTQASLGATGVALGEGKAYNTSAIIALQKAAATPSELTRQNLYQCVEDLGRIFIDFMQADYGKRVVYAPPPPDQMTQEVVAFAGASQNTNVIQTFNFDDLRNTHFTMQLDVGAASYWSEIAAVQTLDNLMATGQLPLTLYLKHMPKGYIPGQDELMEELGGIQPLPTGGQPSTGVVEAAGADPGTLTEAFSQFTGAAMQR